MSALRRGGCLCGAIRYEAEGTPFDETFCHCRMCQKAAGSPVMAWFSVARAGFRWVSGAPKHFLASEIAARGFCADCGTTLTWEGRAHPERIDLAAATLDEPASVAPRDHIWVESRLDWMRGDGLPEYARERLR